METKKITVILSASVREFLYTLPEKARDKIIYNINLVAGGKIDKGACYYYTWFHKEVG